MGWLKKLFGSSGGMDDSSDDAEHAVIVYFDNHGSTDLSRLYETEDQLERAIEAANAGEFDGNEINVQGTNGTLYMYGPDADKLFAAIKPVLTKVDWLRGAKVKLRYGPPEDGVEEKIIRL